MGDKWKQYHQDTKNKPVSKLLVEALAYVDRKGFALDLGSGSLVDSKFLLSSGFEKVIGVDAVSFEKVDDDRFTFIQSCFEDYSFPVSTFDIVVSQFSLPFINPNSFNDTWKRMTASLKPGGLFSGQLFGTKDSWSSNKKNDISFNKRD